MPNYQPLSDLKTELTVVVAPSINKTSFRINTRCQMSNVKNIYRRFRMSRFRIGGRRNVRLNSMQQRTVLHTICVIQYTFVLLACCNLISLSCSRVITASLWTIRRRRCQYVVGEDRSVTPRVSTYDGSSPEVSRSCSVVSAELVKPLVSRAAWTRLPTRIWVIDYCLSRVPFNCHSITENMGTQNAAI